MCQLDDWLVIIGGGGTSVPPWIVWRQIINNLHVCLGVGWVYHLATPPEDQEG